MLTEQLKNENAQLRQTLQAMLDAVPLICQGLWEAAQSTGNKDVFETACQAAERYAERLIQLQSTLWLKFLVEASKGWEVENCAAKIRAAINWSKIEFLRENLSRSQPGPHRLLKWDD